MADEIYIFYITEEHNYATIIISDQQILLTNYAPINVMPRHYPPLGQCWRIGGDLNFAKFKCTTYWACQSVKSQPSPHSNIEEKMGNLTFGTFNCSTCIW